MGGLFEDGARTEPMGFIKLAEWFDALIEPWVDFVKKRADRERSEKWTTFNRIPLSVDAAAAAAGGGNGAGSSSGSGGAAGARRIAPVKRKRRGAMVNHGSYRKHYNHYHNSNGIGNSSSSNARLKRMRK